MRPQRILSGLVAVLSLLTAGCLDFQQQTFVVVFNPDPTKDEITALLVHEGFQVRGKGAAKVNDALTDFRELCQDDRCFYAGHSFWKVPLDPREVQALDEKYRELFL